MSSRTASIGIAIVCLCAAVSASRVRQESISNPSSVTGRQGAAVTLLPDGRTLITGGLVGDEPDKRIDLVIANGLRPAGSLEEPRAWHTATVLPNGLILILGGLGSNRAPATYAELLDPTTNATKTLPIPGWTPRFGHTATLLSDGSVLVAGGLDAQGVPLKTMEMWDPGTNTLQQVDAVLTNPRQNHSATLLSDGRVLLSGGFGLNGDRLTDSEVFDPQAVTVSGWPVWNAALESLPLFVASSSPGNGEVDVPADTRIALRLSRPARVESVNPHSVFLISPTGQKTPVTVIPAENGRLVFVTPSTPLASGTEYRLVVTGVRDQRSIAPPWEVRFTTRYDASASSAIDGALWTPGTGPGDRAGWRHGGPKSPWKSLKPLRAPKGVTALAGQVLHLDGRPVADVTIGFEGHDTRTDRTGRFLLSDLPVKAGELLIDGRSANRGQRQYGVFESRVATTKGHTTILPYTIWMPEIDTKHAVKISSPTTSEVVITTPYIPDLELHLPAGSVIRDEDGHVVTSLSITPIPIDRPPFPLPAHVYVPIYFTVQPGGAYVYAPGGAGARLIYPNYRHEAPGTRLYFWHFDPHQKGWYSYGKGTVTADGRQVVPDPGIGIYEFTGAMVSDPDTAPPDSPSDCESSDGDPVDCWSGIFLLRETDLELPDTLPVQLKRVYRSRDTTSRGFGIGGTHPFDMFLVGDDRTYSYADLILPDGRRIRYTRISTGTGYVNAVYQNTTSPTAFFGSRMTWNGDGWDITLKDGTVYVFGDVAPLRAIRDRYGNTVTITRDWFGGLAQVTSPNGRWIRFTNDDYNRITQAQDNLGRTLTYEYDDDGRLIAVTDPLNGVRQYTYDSEHRLLTVRDPRGHISVTNEYDMNGRVSKQTLADQSTYEFSYTLDSNGVATQTDVTDPRGYTRRVTFNSSGYVLTNTRALGTSEEQTVTIARDASTNFATSRTDSLGRTTHLVRDASGDVLSVTRLFGTANAVTTTFTYSAQFHQLATFTDPLNHTITFQYDAKGNRTSRTNAAGEVISMTYDAAGQLLTQTDALSNETAFTYDGGDLVKIRDPMGNEDSRFLDAIGRVIQMRSALGSITSQQFDAMGRLTQLTDALGATMQWEYDAIGNLVRLRDGRQNETTYAYDSRNRLSARTDPFARNAIYQFDAGGNLVSVTDRKGQVTQYSYDGLNRLTQIQYDDGATKSYSYDNGNRVTQIVDSQNGTVTFTFDGLDQLLGVQASQASIAYTYDAGGRRTSMTVNSDPSIVYSYDDADRLTAITQGSTTVSVGYDLVGRPTTMSLPLGFVRSYEYDAASRLTALRYAQGGTSAGELLYTYDAAGLRTAVSGGLARVELPQAVSSATYDAGNRLSDWGSEASTYDENGNVLTAGLTTYQWNARDQLVGISGPGMTATFEYDPLGRRVEKVVNGVTSSYAFDKSTFVREVVGSQTVHYLTGLRIDEYLDRDDGTTVGVFLTDALNNVVSLKPASGTGTEYTYEPFGGTTTTGAASASPIGFTGRESDGSSLYYYRARYYDTSRMRFLSEDPLEFLAGQNLYSYVNDSPTNLVDPYGTIPGLNYIYCMWYSSKCTNAGLACKKALQEKYRDKNLLEMLECESEGRKDLFKGEDDLYFTKCFAELPECHKMWEYCGKSAVLPPPGSTRPGAPPAGGLPDGNLPAKPPVMPWR